MPMPRYFMRKNLVKTILKKENLNAKKCIEIGYGPGDMLIMFAQMGLVAEGYDFSRDAYQNTANRIATCRQDIRNKITLLGAENEIKPQAYDYLTAFEVLEHIGDDIKALRRFGSYLKPKGKMILSVPSRMSKWGTNDVWAGHYRRYEKTSLANKLALSGFKVNHIWCYGYPLTLILDPLIHLNRADELEMSKGMGKEERTKKSGIKRKKITLTKIASKEVFTMPFYFIQRLFFNTDLGSAYMVVAEKAG